MKGMSFGVDPDACVLVHMSYILCCDTMIRANAE